MNFWVTKVKCQINNYKAHYCTILKNLSKKKNSVNLKNSSYFTLNLNWPARRSFFWNYANQFFENREFINIEYIWRLHSLAEFLYGYKFCTKMQKIFAPPLLPKVRLNFFEKCKKTTPRKIFLRGFKFKIHNRFFISQGCN